MNAERIKEQTVCSENDIEMRDEYDISGLNPRKNPYYKRLKKQITINISNEAIDYFKAMSAGCGIPYQTLINLYLTDCAEKKRELKIEWV